MTLQANLAKLPELCYSVNPLDESVILIKRGETGYFPGKTGHRADLVPFLNARMGVTPAQRVAMEIGSMMGFHVPGADPDAHTAHAKPAQRPGEGDDAYLERVRQETIDAADQKLRAGQQKS